MVAMGAAKFTLLSIYFGSIAAFQVVSKTKQQDLRPGQTLRLSCKADSDFEYCSWRHRGGQGGPRECNLEWKYKQGKVIKTDCDAGLASRTEVVGDYKDHECGISVTDIRLEDAGGWECELEEYALGDWTRGAKHKQDIKVTVTAVTTPTPTVRTTTKATTVRPSEIITEEETETTTLIEDLTMKYDEVEIESQPNTTEASVSGDEEQIKIEALPVTEAEEAEGSSGGLIAGVIVSLLAMILVLSALAVTLVRRRKSQQAIISYLQTERDDQMAANAFLEEAEYHVSIIRDPQNLPLQQKKTIESVTETDEM